MPARALRSESGFGILERPPTPRAFVVHRTRGVPTPDAATSELRSLKIFEEAIVPPGGPVLQGRGPVEPVALRRPLPELIEASVQTASPGLLVISEHHDPGWRAEVDGQDTPLWETDTVILGIPVPAGHHEVRVRFRPVGFLLGTGCAALTILVLAALALRHSPRPYSRIL
jgi:hypothetical protein